MEDTQQVAKDAQSKFEKIIASDWNTKNTWLDHEILGLVRHAKLKPYLKNFQVNPETLAFDLQKSLDQNAAEAETMTESGVEEGEVIKFKNDHKRTIMNLVRVLEYYKSAAYQRK
jgi:hypothetical protein